MEGRESNAPCRLNPGTTGKRIICEISSFRRGVFMTFALLVCYAALVGSWSKRSKSCTAWTLKIEPTGRPETSVTNYQPMFCDSPEQLKLQANDKFVPSSNVPSYYGA